MVCSGGHPHGQFSGGGAVGLIALLLGGHLLGHAPDYPLRPEGPAQYLLAGDAVEDRHHDGVRPYQVAASLHGGIQSAELHGKQQQIHRFCALCRVGVVEVAPLPVVPDTFPAVAAGPLPVGQHEGMALSDGAGELIGVQDTQGAQSDDAHSLNGFHTDSSLSR